MTNTDTPDSASFPPLPNLPMAPHGCKDTVTYHAGYMDALRRSSMLVEALQKIYNDPSTSPVLRSYIIKLLERYSATPEVGKPFPEPKEATPETTDKLLDCVNLKLIAVAEQLVKEIRINLNTDSMVERSTALNQIVIAVKSLAGVTKHD
jgi:hypothetical protein